MGTPIPIIKKIPINSGNPISANFYITSSHCIDKFIKIYQSGSIWAAGAKTMQKLAQRGFWVNGCTDSLGDLQLKNFKESKFLSLMLSKLDWKTLTSKTGSSSVGELIPAYEHVITPPTKNSQKIFPNVKIFIGQVSFNIKSIPSFFPRSKIKTIIVA